MELHRLEEVSADEDDENRVLENEDSSPEGALASSSRIEDCILTGRDEKYTGVFFENSFSRDETPDGLSSREVTNAGIAAELLVVAETWIVAAADATVGITVDCVGPAIVIALSEDNIWLTISTALDCDAITSV